MFSFLDFFCVRIVGFFFLLSSLSRPISSPRIVFAEDFYPRILCCNRFRSLPRSAKANAVVLFPTRLLKLHRQSICNIPIQH